MNGFDHKEGYQASEVRRMKAKYESGGLSRRQFMQGLMATGLALGTATAIVTGSRDVRAETPKRGGRVRFSSTGHGPTDTLDPQLFTDGIDYTRGRAHLNNLAQFNDDLSVRPELAESWEVNSNATEFVFHLRKGVTWHDGKDFTADDVVYTMNRHMGEASISKAKTLVAMVSEWKKIDQHTVKASLSSPNSDLLPTLATFHFKIVQDGCDDMPGHFNKVIGTGPYTCEEFSPGVRSIAKRNPNYWREGPWLDELELFAITDQVARVNAIASGEIDLAAAIDTKAFKQIEDAEGVSIFSTKSGQYVDVVMMLDRHPGDNPDLVQAVKLLQNRKRLVRSVFKGHGSFGNDHPIGEAYADHCEALEQTELDIDRAKFHVNKSGISEVELVASEGIPNGMEFALLFQAEARKAGLTVNVKKVPYDGYWGSVWMNTPMHLSNWNMRPTAYVMMELAYAPDAPWNESQWKNERMGVLLEQVRAETDPGRREEMFCEMQGLIRAEAGTALPVHLNYIDAISDKVKGMPRVPLAMLGGCEWPEFIWLEA